MSADVAKTAILKDNSLLNVIIISQGSAMTKDYRMDRVWVVVDTNNKVVKTPFIGWLIHCILSLFNKSIFNF